MWLFALSKRETEAPLKDPHPCAFGIRFGFRGPTLGPQLPPVFLSERCVSLGELTPPKLDVLNKWHEQIATERVPLP